MRILVLTPSMPYPPDRGDRIRTFHLLSRLAREHEIWLLAVDDRAAGPRSSEGLSQFCARHEVCPLSPLGRHVRGTRSLLRGEAIRVGWFQHPNLERQLNAWLREERFDASLVFSCAMAPYWLNSKRARELPLVMDFIDLESAKWGSYARYSSPPRKWIFEREQHRLVDLECEIDSMAARSCFVSESEVQSFSTIRPESGALSLPNGVDGGFFARPQLGRRADPPRLLFVGQMDDGANEDAVLHFVRAILPRVRQQRPDVQFDVVGPRPTPAVKALRAMGGIRVTGWVEDTRPYLREASIAVVPLRIAQGTQNKVLEAMASSLPVVASRTAARGIRRPRGEHIRVEENADAFADAVLELLEDPQAAATQAEAALDMVHSLHSWDASARQLSRLLQEAVGS